MSILSDFFLRYSLYAFIRIDSSESIRLTLHELILLTRGDSEPAAVSWVVRSRFLVVFYFNVCADKIIFLIVKDGVRFYLDEFGL